ncbi:unnamed protein product, partial [Didymodactylos carnosus]
LSTGFRITGVQDGGTPSKQQPSVSSTLASPTLASPVVIRIQVNNKSQNAVVDTGSPFTIIHKNFLKRIYHKKFIYKHISYSSANSSSINIIDQVELEIKINDEKTFITADVASNLVTEILLGKDFMAKYKILIDNGEKQVIRPRKNKQSIRTPFIEQPDIHYPVYLTDQITIPPFSEKLIDARTQINTTNNLMFEPTTNLHRKGLFTASALLNAKKYATKVLIINANNRQFTLWKHTKLGTIAFQTEPTVCYTIASKPVKGRLDKSREFQSKIPIHQCYVCQKNFKRLNPIRRIFEH